MSHSPLTADVGTHWKIAIVSTVAIIFAVCTDPRPERLAKS